MHAAEQVMHLTRELRTLRERKLDASPAAGEIIAERVDFLLDQMWTLLPEQRQTELREAIR